MRYNFHPPTPPKKKPTKNKINIYSVVGGINRICITLYEHELVVTSLGKTVVNIEQFGIVLLQTCDFSVLYFLLSF